MTRISLASVLKKTGFDKLEKREKGIVIFGVLFVICFLLLQLGLSPYLEASKKLDKSLDKKREELTELRALQQEYRLLKNETGGIREQLSRRPASFSLFTFLDAKATEAGVKEYINYMKPSATESEGELQESLVEMKLTGISLQQMVDYLKLIESPENVVSIKRISIQESGKEKGLLEVVLQIVTFMEKG